MRVTTSSVVWVFTLLGALSLGGCLSWQLTSSPFSTSSSAPILPVLPSVETVMRALDGEMGTPEQARAPVAALVIDNMAEARPPAGIARARLVMEAPAEAGITRLLALYPLDQDIVKIGPVRSLRPYFLTLAESMSDMVAHVGGSPEALRLADASSLFNLNEFSHSTSFWRDEKRTAPHNVYTSTSRLYEAFLKYVPNVKEVAPWVYEESPAWLTAATPTVSALIPASDPAYAVTWKYDQILGAYQRFQNTVLHRDEDGIAVQAVNIMVIKTTITVLDEVGRRAIRLKGEGEGVLLRNGVRTVGTWRIKTGDRPRMFDKEGVELALAPGITWIHIVPTKIVLEY